MSALALALAACRGERGGADAYVIPGEGGPRLSVEVLNASGKPGLAKLGTRVLRRSGIDVVSFGTAMASIGTLESTRIVVRRGTREVGERVRRALAAATGEGWGGKAFARVVVELDSTRLLDASVFLGADFPPRLEFHP